LWRYFARFVMLLDEGGVSTKKVRKRLALSMSDGALAHRARTR
jgi:hypothetical protein